MGYKVPIDYSPCPKCGATAGMGLMSRHGYGFVWCSARAKVGSDAESLERAAQLLAHSDPRMTRRVYRRKPERIKPAG